MVVTGGEKDERHVVPVAAQAPANFEAVEVGHVDVEDDQIGRVVFDHAQRLDPAAGELDVVAGETERRSQHFGEAFLIVDHEELSRSGHDGDTIPPAPSQTENSLRIY